MNSSLRPSAGLVKERHPIRAFGGLQIHFDRLTWSGGAGGHLSLKESGVAYLKGRRDSEFANARPLRIAYGAGRCQFGELWRPPSMSTSAAIPLLVLYHGGFWRSKYGRGLMHPLARDATQRGWAVWNVEYRRVGIAGGGGGFPETFDDALRALRAVAKLRGVDMTRIVTCGHSAGGHLALWAAGAAKGLSDVWSPTLKGLMADTAPIASPVAAVSLAGVVDLIAGAELALGQGAVPRLMGGAPSDQAARFREVSLIDSLPLGVHQIVVHGTRDTIVPPKMSETYAKKAIAAGDAVDLQLVQGAGHMDVIDPLSRAWELVVKCLERLLS